MGDTQILIGNPKRDGHVHRKPRGKDERDGHDHKKPRGRDERERWARS